MSWFTAPPKAPKVERGGTKFSIAEQLLFLAAWVLYRILQGLPFLAKDALSEVDEYRHRGIMKANTVGDALGDRGFGLYRSPTGFHCDARNAKRVMACYKDHEKLAKQLGYKDAQQLWLAIARLDWSQMTAEDRESLAAEFGYEDAAACQVAINALPDPDWPFEVDEDDGIDSLLDKLDGDETELSRLTLAEEVDGIDLDKLDGDDETEDGDDEDKIEEEYEEV